MKEAHNHKRVSAEGQKIGADMVRLAEPEIKALAAEGMPDARCVSCAFRHGTVPNGCIQTMGDVVKCVMEKTPFVCHVHKDEAGQPAMCHGWLATQVATAHVPAQKVPWAFTPPDEDGSHGT